MLSTWVASIGKVQPPPDTEQFLHYPIVRYIRI